MCVCPCDLISGLIKRDFENNLFTLLGFFSVKKRLFIEEHISPHRKITVLHPDW